MTDDPALLDAKDFKQAVVFDLEYDIDLEKMSV